MDKTKLLLFLITFTQICWAGPVTREQCSDVDIRESNPRIKNNPELLEHFNTPRNQDSIGWCYAFSAADLVSAEVGSPVSAIHTSNLFNRHVERNIFLKAGYDIGNMFSGSNFDAVYEGGFTNQAVKELSRKQVCAEKDLPFDSYYTNQTFFLIRSLEKLKSEAAANKFLMEQVCSELESVLRVSSLRVENVSEIAETLTREKLSTTIEKIAADRCQGKMLEVPALKAKKMSRPGNAKSATSYFAKINQLLESGKPLGVDYNVSSFTSDRGLHASVATARRWRNGRCEYKIRNSWGKTCSAYLTGIPCERSEGAFWISDEEFQNSIHKIHYIE